MAIYHLSVKHGSRKQGKSAAAHANYIAREGTYAQGRYVEDFVHAESWNMPDWSAENAIDFWQAADIHERANGRLYTEIEIALPRELDQAQQLGLVRRFVSEQVGDEHPVTWAVHNRPALDGGMNPHAHIMLSERTLDGVERTPEVFFKRANAASPEKGGAAKDPAWNHRDKVEELRRGWEVTANRVLLDLGLAPTLERKSLEARGIDRAPEPKLGPEQTAMLRRGEVTEDAKQVLALRQDRAQAAALHRRIIEVEKRVAEQQRDTTEARPDVDLARSVEPSPSPHRLQSRDATPERTEAKVETERPPDAVSAPGAAVPTLEPTSKPKPPRKRPALQPEPPSERKTPLPDDVFRLADIWDQELQRHLRPISERTSRLRERIIEQSRRTNYALLAHREAEPQAPKFLARWRQKGYQRRLQVWQDKYDKLRARDKQLDKRSSAVNAYWSHTTLPSGRSVSKGVLIAEASLRAEQPELARKLEQARARWRQEEQERRERAAERTRQCDRERGPSRGLER